MVQLIYMYYAYSVSLPEGVKDGCYKNNYENDTRIKDEYCHYCIATDYRLK